MELLNPVERIGNQEVLDLRLAEIKDLRSPVRVFSLAWVRIFIARCPVKLRQPMGVLRKMSGHPVQNHANAVAVQVIHQIGEILRGPVPGCRRVVARYLIAPGAVKRMFRDPHQLDVRVACLQEIVGDGMRKIPVIVESILMLTVRVAHPAPDMALIDGNRRLVLDKVILPPHPSSVRPFDRAKIRDDGSRPRAVLCLIRIRISLIQLSAILCVDQILVHLPRLCRLDKGLPDPGGLSLLHRNIAFIPAVELSNQRDSRRMRRPHSKVNALPSLVR